jgi:hypothetical protein
VFCRRKEEPMREGNMRETEEKLREIASEWIKEKMPERMQSVGVTKEDVLQQLQLEADQWLKWNLEQFKEGKPGTDSPDAGIEKPDATKVDTPW